MTPLLASGIYLVHRHTCSKASIHTNKSKNQINKRPNHWVIWEVWFVLFAEVDGLQVFIVKVVTDEWYQNFHSVIRNS